MGVVAYVISPATALFDVCVTSDCIRTAGCGRRIDERRFEVVCEGSSVTELYSRDYNYEMSLGIAVAGKVMGIPCSTDDELLVRVETDVVGDRSDVWTFG